MSESSPPSRSVAYPPDDLAARVKELEKWAALQVFVTIGVAVLALAALLLAVWHA